jgi:hypothetical protein
MHCANVSSISAVSRSFAQAPNILWGLECKWQYILAENAGPRPTAQGISKNCTNGTPQNADALKAVLKIFAVIACAAAVLLVRPATWSSLRKEKGPPGPNKHKKTA